jgi:ubiquinone/menaquinone biosynthesis C-methylase UbiE
VGEKDMKKRIFIVPLAAILVGFINPAANFQKRSFQIEDWEKGLNERQPPIKIMDAIGLEQGMVIGEVGAGTGRMTMWLADRVGESGKVYANDIDRSALEYLKRRCKREGSKNVEIIVGKMENPGFLPGSLDIAFMINVYHHLADPLVIIRNLRPSLKRDGILAIVECDPDKVDWGDEHGCSSKQNMIEDLKKGGFEVIRIDSFLEEDSIYIAKPIIAF